MAELRELEKKLQSIDSLREIVTAMRNLAAVYVRRAEAALEATRPYNESVETALRAVLARGQARTPPTGAHRIVILFASDQGLCGRYNDRIVTAVFDEVHKPDAVPADVVAIGRRGSELLAMRGVKPVLTAPAPTSLEGIHADVTELAADVYGVYARHEGADLLLAYNSYQGMGRFKERIRPVLPPRLDSDSEKGKKPFRYEPILTADPTDLLGFLMEEYFFIELYQALLESHASENGARLLSMTAATGNIDERFVELTKEFQTVRQDTITAELLDVVGGAEALRRD